MISGNRDLLSIEKCNLGYAAGQYYDVVAEVRVIGLCFFSFSLTKTGHVFVEKRSFQYRRVAGSCQELFHAGRT